MNEEVRPLAVGQIGPEAKKIIDASDPYWVDVRPAGEFLQLPEKTILHSGPPISFERMCILHRRGMANACLFEGWANDVAEAEAMLSRGEVRVAAAMDYATVGSGTGIVTASVPLLIVEDRTTGLRADLCLPCVIIEECIVL